MGTAAALCESSDQKLTSIFLACAKFNQLGKETG